VDEEHWAAYRKRLRERAARQFFLIFGPIAMLVAVWSVIGPIDLAPGDYRAEPVFRLVMGGAAFIFGLVAFVTSARWLIADRRK
jgi:hypothetical protein